MAGSIQATFAGIVPPGQSYSWTTPQVQQYGIPDFDMQREGKLVGRKTFATIGPVKTECEGEPEQLPAGRNNIIVSNPFYTVARSDVTSSISLDKEGQHLHPTPVEQTADPILIDAMNNNVCGLDFHTRGWKSEFDEEKGAACIDGLKEPISITPIEDLRSTLTDEMGSDLLCLLPTTNTRDIIMEPPGLRQRLLKDLPTERRILRDSLMSLSKYAYTRLNIPILSCCPVVDPDTNIIESCEWLGSPAVTKKLSCASMTGFTQEVENNLAKDYAYGYAQRPTRDHRPMRYSIKMVVGPEGLELPKPWEPVLHMGSDQAGVFFAKLMDVLFRIEFGSDYPGRKFRKFANLQKSGAVRPPTPLKIYDSIAEEIMSRTDYFGRARPRGPVKSYHLQLVCAYLLYKMGRANHTWCEAPLPCCTAPISWVDGQWRKWLAAHQEYDGTTYPESNCRVASSRKRAVDNRT